MYAQIIDDTVDYYSLIVSSAYLIPFPLYGSGLLLSLISAANWPTFSNDLKKMKSLHGLTRTLVNNMVIGVTDGYEKKLEVNGVGSKRMRQSILPHELCSCLNFVRV